MPEARPQRLTKTDANTLRKKAGDLRHSIVESALSDPDVADTTTVQQFRTAHEEQRRAIETGRQRAEQLGKAKAELEPVESDLKQKQQALTKAQSSLSEFRRPLGHAAFQARLEGAVTDQPVFADRLAVHERIEELRKEYENLAPAPSAGTVEKTRAKAQQLAVAGKIKLEETKIGKLDSQIGQQLIEESQEGSVRCEQTDQVISQIAERRAEIAQLTAQENQSRESLTRKAGQLSEALNLPQIEGSRALDKELGQCNAAATQAEMTQSQLENALPAKLSADASVPANSKVGTSLAELRQVEEQLEHAPKSPIAGLVSWFSELGTAGNSQGFVAFPGVEWTTGRGHACLYWIGAKYRGWPRTVPSLYHALADAGAYGKFNHPCNPDSPDTTVFNHFEYSVVGDQVIHLLEVRKDYEETSYIYALRTGWHVAPDGSTDTHAPNWGNRAGRLSWTGILARELTLDGIYEAVTSRHCFATRDRTCELRFYTEVGDKAAIMGDIIPGVGREIEFKVDVADNEPMGRIIFYENGTPTDSSYQTSASFRRVVDKPSFYFVKVYQKDGDRMWSAPIWVE